MIHLQFASLNQSNQSYQLPKETIGQYHCNMGLFESGYLIHNRETAQLRN
jgi:hypothetical protein